MVYITVDPSMDLPNGINKPSLYKISKIIYQLLNLIKSILVYNKMLY